MGWERKISNLFKLNSDEMWLRHANPLSVYSRFFMLPLLAISFWSRVWFGWWSLIPIIAVLFWLWLNPRIFPKAKSTNNWASKAVLGERVWTNRKEIPIPKHHRTLPNILSIVGLIGFIFFIYGLYTLELSPTILGGIISFISKIWFCDRMVWLYEDMKHLPEYKNWLY
ncbi:MAG: DUF6653 family protein [candidate division WOR-3 bacterium]